MRYPRRYRIDGKIINAETREISVRSDKKETVVNNIIWIIVVLRRETRKGKRGQ